MNAKTPVIILALVALLIIATIGPAYGDRRGLPSCMSRIGEPPACVRSSSQSGESDSQRFGSAGRETHRNTPKISRPSVGWMPCLRSMMKIALWSRNSDELYRQAQDEAKQCMQQVQ